MSVIDLLDTQTMETRLLEQFVTVAAEGSVTRAAERLWAAQSTVSAGIASLERRLGAADEQVDVAQSGRWPSVSLSASYGTAYTTARDEAFTDQLDLRRGGSIGVGLSVPLFDRGSAARATEQALARLSPSLAGSLAQYEQLRLEPVDYRGLDAADLEFTYVDQVELRVLDRAVVAEDGRTYYLYWQVNASDWQDALPVFEQMLETFQPAG